MTEQTNEGDALRRVLAALTEARLNHRPSSGIHWAQCPNHDDDSPSLVITQNNGRVLISCYAGCSLHLILAELGLTADDLFDKSVTS